jgi:hypothetical protein
MFENLLRTDEKEKESDEIFDLLKDSPTLEALKGERQAKVNADRRAALERIEAAERERSETLPALQRKFEAAKQRVENIEAKFKQDMAAACTERDRVDYDHATARFRIDNALSKDRRLLLDTAAPEIDELYRWLLAEDDKARNAVAVRLGIKRDIVGASRLVVSNAAAISQHRTTIRSVMNRLEAMKFEVIDDVAAEIATAQSFNSAGCLS